MWNPNQKNLEYLFHPHSIALVGITTVDPEHWTRTFLDSLIEFGFDGPIYLVNPKGGKIKGRKVHTRLKHITNSIDYVVSLVNARLAPQLVEECAEKGVRTVHLCTAGFSETGEEDGIKLESELVEIARKKRVTIIGPNCMGIYCPKSRLSFSPLFPKESGSVGVVSQSGGNTTYLVRHAALRGVRFSKVISYGNACDLDESDLLEYFATDADTKIIAIYIEGIKDGKRFRRALQEATREKTVILLKGGITEGGARAVAGHTAALAGSRSTWDALCKQLGIIRVDSVEEMVDVLVTLLFMPIPRGRNAMLVGFGGGASVLIADEFEKRGLRVPPLPQEIISQIREFTPAAGNILRNPVDYTQGRMNARSVVKTLDILSRWKGADFLVMFVRMGQSAGVGSSSRQSHLPMGAALNKHTPSSKPVAIVLEPSMLPEEGERILVFLRESVSSGFPVYYSFASAANAINLVLSRNECQSR